MANSIFKSALDAVAARIGTLSLEGDPRIKVRRMAHDNERFYDGITVHPVTEKNHDGTNVRESVGYGCAVTMVQNNNNDDDYKLDRLLLWRETIRREFVEDVQLSGVGTTCTVKVEYGYPIDWNELFDVNYDVGRLVIRVYSLETRT